jgi:hypothetical protein
MEEHQLTVRDYLRHSNLNVINKYLQATSKTKQTAQGKPVDAILPGGILSSHNPVNLGPGWIGFDFQKAFGRPTQIINDVPCRHSAVIAADVCYFSAWARGWDQL